MNLGPFSVMKWIPASQAEPTPALQNMLPKLTEKEKKQKLKRKSYSGRPSTGSTRASLGGGRESFGGGAGVSDVVSVDE